MSKAKRLISHETSPRDIAGALEVPHTRNPTFRTPILTWEFEESGFSQLVRRIVLSVSNNVSLSFFSVAMTGVTGNGVLSFQAFTLRVNDSFEGLVNLDMLLVVRPM